MMKSLRQLASRNLHTLQNSWPLLATGFLVTTQNSGHGRLHLGPGVPSLLRAHALQVKRMSRVPGLGNWHISFGPFIEQRLIEHFFTLLLMTALHFPAFGRSENGNLSLSSTHCRPVLHIRMARVRLPRVKHVFPRAIHPMFCSIQHRGTSIAGIGRVHCALTGP